MLSSIFSKIASYKNTILDSLHIKYIVGIGILCVTLLFIYVVRQQHTQQLIAQDFSYTIATPNLLREDILQQRKKNEQQTPEIISIESIKKEIQEGKIENALSMYYSLYTKEPENMDYLSGIGTLLIQTKSWNNALEAYKKLFEYSPSPTPEEFKGFVLAFLHSKVPHTKEELEMISQSIEHTTGEDKKYLSCIRALFLEQDMKTICQALEHGAHGSLWKNIHERILRFETQRDGQKTYLTLILAGLLSEEGWDMLAYAKAQEVIKIQPDYRDAWILAGYSALRLGEYEKAQFFLEDVYKKDTTKVHVQYLLGNVYDHLGNKEKALSYYTIALKNNFPSPDIITKRIHELYLSNRQYGEALRLSLEQLQKSKKLHPSYYLEPLWILLHYEKKYESALSLAAEGVRQFPNDPLMKGMLAWVQCTTDTNKDDSWKELEATIKDQKEDVTLHILLLRCALERKDKNGFETYAQFFKTKYLSPAEQVQWEELQSLSKSL